MDWLYSWYDVNLISFRFEMQEGSIFRKRLNSQKFIINVIALTAAWTLVYECFEDMNFHILF